METLLELQQLLAVTELRATQARAARQRAARYRDHYKLRAEELRKQAARTPSFEMRAKLLRLASLYEALSKLGNEGVGDRQTEPDTALGGPPTAKPETDRVTLNLRAPAWRAAEAQIKRVLALSEALPNDDRGIALRARVGLSRDLYFNTLKISRQTRDMIAYSSHASSPRAEERTEVKSPATMDELRELLDVTKECFARAVTAQKRAAKYLDHGRFQIEEYRRQAARATSAEVRDSLLRIADSYQRLVRSAEGLESPRSEPVGNEPQGIRGMAEREGDVSSQAAAEEDPVAKSRRHVAEAEGHIARQEALVAKLSADNRHAALAAQAREILATLKQTLRLAHEHLALELKK